MYLSRKEKEIKEGREEGKGEGRLESQIIFLIDFHYLWIEPKNPVILYVNMNRRRVKFKYQENYIPYF